MAPRLKTYAAEIDGLHDWIVAAPNQKAALAAFGVNQDLFAKGEARVETAPEMTEAANAQPGVALRRLKGSSDLFAPVGSGGGASGWAAALEAAAKQPKSEKGKAPPTSADPAPAPSRRALDRAEAALAELEEDRAQALADIEEERRALDEREAELKARYKDRVARAKERVKEEAAEYRRAGGR